MQKFMHYVYALKSGLDGRIYVGMTADIIRRLKEHNAGLVRSTKFYKPWRLIFSEKISTRIEAREREKYWKSGCGKEHLKTISLVALRQLAEVGRML